MTIMLFGISNVGKSTTAELLASELNYTFYDIDEETKKRLETTLEDFVNTGTVYQRDAYRGELIEEILCEDEGNKVIAVTPMSYSTFFNYFLKRKDILAIELQDSPKNIFDRLIFSDENDVIYKDDDYKNQHKEEFLEEIRKDIEHYAKSFIHIKNKFNINNDPPEIVVRRIMDTYKLNSAQHYNTNH